MSINFFTKLTAMTIVIGIATALFLYFVGSRDATWFWAVLGFYYLLGLVIGYKTQKAVTSESNSKFFLGVIGGTGIRMLLSLLFLVIYLLISDMQSKDVIVYYLILYLFYTIFEIYQLVHKLRAEKQTTVESTTD